MISTIALLLTKFVGKTGEISLRRALGASRKVIFKQQIAEVAVIGLAGGLIGLALAGIGLQGIEYLYDAPAGLVRLDWTMMFTAIGVAIIPILGIAIVAELPDRIVSDAVPTRFVGLAIRRASVLGFVVAVIADFCHTIVVGFDDVIPAAER